MLVRQLLADHDVAIADLYANNHASLRVGLVPLLVDDPPTLQTIDIAAEAQGGHDDGGDQEHDAQDQECPPVLAGLRHTPIRVAVLRASPRAIRVEYDVPKNVCAMRRERHVDAHKQSQSDSRVAETPHRRSLYAM